MLEQFGKEQKEKVEWKVVAVIRLVQSEGVSSKFGWQCGQGELEASKVYLPVALCYPELFCALPYGRY